MDAIFGPMFNLLFRTKDIQGDLLDYGMYGMVGIIMLLVAVVFCFGFYFLMDKTKFASPWYWLFVMVDVMIIVFLVGWLVPSNTLSRDGLEYPTSTYIYFGLIAAIYAGLIFFLLSLVLKRFRTNLTRTPF